MTVGLVVLVRRVLLLVSFVGGGGLVVRVGGARGRGGAWGAREKGEEICFKRRAGKKGYEFIRVCVFDRLGCSHLFSLLNVCFYISPSNQCFLLRVP